MVHLYQMMHAGVDVEPSEMFTLNASGVTRGHSLKICKPLALTRVRQNSFAVRSINDWSRLPADVIESPSVDIFKKRLDSLLGAILVHHSRHRLRNGTTIKLGESGSYRPYGLYPNDLKIKVKVTMYLSSMTMLIVRDP